MRKKNALFFNIPRLDWWHLPGSKLLINYVHFSESQVEYLFSVVENDYTIGSDDFETS